MASLSQIEHYRTWPETKNHLAAIILLTVGSVEPNLPLKPSNREKRKISIFTTGFPSGKGLSILSELWKSAVLSIRRFVGTSAKWELKFCSSSSTTVKRRREFYKGTLVSSQRSKATSSKNCQIILTSSVNFCKSYNVHQPIYRLSVMGF